MWEQEERVTFDSSPNFELDDPNLRWIDGNYDKRIDVMITTESAYFIWLAQPDNSWSQSADLVVAALAVGTPLVFSAPHVKLADMTGDRRQDFVYVRDGLVAYFPSNGMGDYGEMVSMINPPQGLGNLDKELQLDDINNDGLADLVFPLNGSVHFWLNMGNDTLAPEQVITGTPYYTPLDTALRMADIDGDGASELLYSRYPAPEDEVIQVVDFSTGSQPHLLNSIDNGLDEAARSNDFSRSKARTPEVVTTSSAQTLWYLSDHLGGTSLMVDANGEITSEVAYYPYGLTRYESNGEEVRYRYTGKELDATGLHYFGARYYDAKTATWLSTDPIFDAYMPTGDKERDQKLPGMGGVFNAVNLNVYHYAGNNPVRYVDPDGNEATEKHYTLQ